MGKNKLGVTLLLIALILFVLSNPFNLTGNVIGGGEEVSLFFIVGIVFLIGSFIAFVSRQSLDAIIVPTGLNDEVRADEAAKEYLTGKKKAKFILISGKEGDVPLKDSQRYEIYKRLRDYRIKPSEMKIEGRSKNTLENFLYSLKKIKQKGARSIGISSSPSQLDRFEDILAVAKKERIVDKGFKIYRIETDESFSERVYGFFSRIFYRYKLSGGLEKAKERETPNWIEKGKSLFHYFFKK